MAFAWDRRDAFPTQARRDAADRSQVTGDIIAGHAIAARGAASEDAILVTKIDGQSIDLWLDDPIQSFLRQKPLHPIYKLAQLGLGVGIVQAEHRLDMLNRLKGFERFSAHSLAG